MKYAVAVTVLLGGVVLVYSGFKDIDVWQTILGVVRNTGAVSPAPAPSSGHG